jgi:type II secretory pathway pseudopilin PulG
MKTSPAKRRHCAAFTLVESMVSAGVAVISGGAVFLALNSGLNLFAKNTSANAAHQQMLKAINHMTTDVHSAVSLPQLVNSNLTNYTGTGNAAGISMQVYSMGPFPLMAMSTPTFNATKITVNTGTTTRPAVGQRVILSDYLVEEDIVASVANTGNSAWTDLTIANPVWRTCSLGANCLITNRIAFAVTNGELRYYRRASNTAIYNVLARGVTTATPFRFGAYPGGATNNRLINGTLALSDPTYSNRGYQALGLSVNFQLPMRAKLTNYR